MWLLASNRVPREFGRTREVSLLLLGYLTALRLGTWACRRRCE